MIESAAYRGQTVAVAGLARSGLASALSLMAGGTKVAAWDDNEEARQRALEAGVTIEDLNARDWSDLAALVISPGFPLTHPEPHRYVKLAQSVEIPVIGDIELFALTMNAIEASQRPKVIGITGTNGKSTTTALLGHILKSAGRDAQVGGNIGRGILDLDPPHAGSVYVLELSSYQLDLAHSLRCDAALLLNFAEDHLERHGGMAGYIKAKERIFRNQTGADAAIVGVDDPWSKAVATRLIAQAGRTVVPVSSGRALSRGVYALGGALYDASGASVRQAAELSAAEALPGAHNHQNIAAAYAAARAVGLDRDAIVAGINSFPGLEHRLEKAGELDGVAFVNDSKATNIDAVEQALAVYEPIYWIAGGRHKDESLKPLAPFFSRVAKAYLIGEAQDRFARELKGEVTAESCGDIVTAVRAAFEDARSDGRPGATVLLSPGCASFDQFKDFEDRGRAFKAAVNTLIDSHPALEETPA